ncbi:Non-specific serine/threonine protein kinase [Bertholletia excelsa]
MTPTPPTPSTPTPTTTPTPPTPSTPPTTPTPPTPPTTPTPPPGTESSSHPPQFENSPPPSSLQLALNLPSVFTCEQLATATDNFSDANLLGRGGFGYVHKGVLPNGREVAVKQLTAGSRQGDREFQAEVEIISRVHHKHLVSLVGYCITGSERVLVYEFVPNNTLEFHLHGIGRPAMDWPTRLKIALGAAKGLAYLHEECDPPIIHRDIKAANVLLDFKLQAKVSDFGLAKLVPDNNTHVSTRVMGTFGYLAPEYASSGRLTEKCDVFSFGVMLLELITGRQPTDQCSKYGGLVDWARPLLSRRALEDGNFGNVVDRQLQMRYNRDEMARMVACAASCVCLAAEQRPSMSEVVRALEGNLPTCVLIERLPPAHSGGRLDSDTNQYQIFRRMVLGNPDSGNAECSEPTSRHG